MHRCKVVTALAVALTLGTTACSGSENGSAAKDDISVGVVRFSAANPVENVFYDAYEKAARKLGYKTSSIDPNAQTDRAIAGMQTFVSKQVDMIVTGVFDSNALRAGAMAAKQAGIPVATLAGGTADGIGINVDAGTDAAQKIAKVLMDKSGGKGSLLVLGYKSAPSCAVREQVLMDVIKGTELEANLTRHEVTVPGQVEAGTNFTQAFLAKHPVGSGKLSVWSCFDDPALGAITALKQQSRTDVDVYGTNGVPAALQAVKDGTMTATAWPDLVNAAEQLAKDTAGYIEAGASADPVDVPLPFELVTAETIGEFIAAHPEALKEQ